MKGDNQMQKIDKLRFPIGTTAILRIGKKNEGSTLSIKGIIINYCDNEYIQLEDLENRENEELNVTLKDLTLYYKQHAIYKLDCLFNPKQPIFLDVESDFAKDQANLNFFGINVGIEPIDFVPDLFTRRNHFKAKIIDDTCIDIERYCPFHQHTENSHLDGIVRIDDYVNKIGYSGAITDHGNMFGFLKFYNAMKKAGKKPILGFEAYVETLPDKQGEEGKLQTEHLILLAKNEQGLKNLFKLTSRAYEHFYSKPHVTIDLLKQYHEGILCTSACIAGTLGQALIEGNENRADRFIKQMIEIFADDFYLEIQNHQFELEAKIMNQIKNKAKQFGIKMVAGIDSHYLNEEDSYVHELWLCLQTKSTIHDPKHMKFSGNGYHVMSNDEAVQLFHDQLECLDNTLEIADKCNVEIKFQGYHLPEFPLPKGYTSQSEYFMYCVREGYKKRFLHTDKYRNKDYVERIKYELDVIMKMGYPSYFTIVADFIGWAKDDAVKEHLEQFFPSTHFDQSKIPDRFLKEFRIPIGPGRGSAAGSLVAYCLDITTIDPIEYGLLFERFLSVDRVSMPDIDVDISDEYREFVIDYCRFKYGADHVSRIVTFGSAMARAVIRDTARVTAEDSEEGRKSSLQLADKVAKLVPQKPNVQLKYAIFENEKKGDLFSPELNDLYKNNKKVKEILDISLQLEGLKKNCGQHACGVLITPTPVTDYMPQILLENRDTKKKEPTTQLTMTECEDMGCLKMDFLSLRTLSVIDHTIKMINQNKKDIPITYEAIPIDDVAVYDYIRKGITAGIFQIESPYMRSLMQELYQDVGKNIDFTGMIGFQRLCDANALGRPGPMDEIPNYIHNMLRPEDIHYDTPLMEETLRPTNGIIVYQEQLMALVRSLAGFSGAQSDIVRKACSKKKEALLTEYGEYFVHGSVKLGIDGCIHRGISENVAKQIWQKMVKFGQYAFNKSHSVCYSELTAKTAWLVTYYPAEYYCAILNSFVNNASRIKSYIAVCKKLNINVLPPDIKQSEANFSIDITGEKKAIRFGLSGIRDVGKKAQLIVAEKSRNGKYKDFGSFIHRMIRVNAINKSVLEALIYAGALDCFSGTRKNKIDAIENTLKKVKKDKTILRRSNRTWFDIAHKRGIEGFNQQYDYQYEVNDLEIPKQTKLAREKEFAGFYISEHPLDEYADVYKSNKIIECSCFEQTEISEEDQETSQDIDAYNGVDSQYYNVPISVAGIVTDFKVRYTRKDNSAMATFKIEDQTGELSAVIFSKHFAEYKDKLEDGKIVVLSGKVNQNDFGLQMNVDKVIDINALSAKLSVKRIELRGADNIDKARNQYAYTLQIIHDNPGNIPLYFYRDHNFLPMNRTIDLTARSLSEIQSLYGEQNCNVIYN